MVIVKKQFTKEQKHMLMQCISDANIFGLSDKEGMKYIEEKTGRSISLTSYQRYKKVAVNDESANAWINNFGKIGFVNHYRKRISEIELLQQTTFKLLNLELAKTPEKQDKKYVLSLIEAIRQNNTNKGEVTILKEIVDGCLNMGIKDIIVTTPYKQQERLCNFYLQKRIRIGTVDEFQGQEAEVTIISTVRSNNKSNYQEAIGFVNIPRSCVAFSRSKRKTIIVGDRNTLIKNRFLAKTIDTIISKDGYLIWRDY